MVGDGLNLIAPEVKVLEVRKESLTFIFAESWREHSQVVAAEVEPNEIGQRREKWNARNLHSQHKKKRHHASYIIYMYFKYISTGICLNLICR